MNKITKALLASLTTISTIMISELPSLAQEQFYYIRARHSNQCLNVLNSGQSNGDNVVQAADCGSASSQWQLIPASGAYFYIRARHSGQCLNVKNSGRRNGDNVVQGFDCRSDNFQWALLPAERRYKFIEAKHSGQCLNVLNRGQNNGDNVVQGEECYADSFQWEIIRASSSNSRPRRSSRSRRKHIIREYNRR